MKINLDISTSSINYFKEALSVSLTAQQKKILLVVAAALSLIAAAFLIYMRCYFKGQKNAHDDRPDSPQKVIKPLPKEDIKLSPKAMVYHFPEGAIVEGTFHNGDGKGKITLLSGTVIEGEFLHGVLHGKGKMTTKMLVQEGEFQNGRLNGQGKRYFPHRNVIMEGTYKDGVLIQAKKNPVTEIDVPIQDDGKIGVIKGDPVKDDAPVVRKDPIDVSPIDPSHLRVDPDQIGSTKTFFRLPDNNTIVGYVPDYSTATVGDLLAAAAAAAQAPISSIRLYYAGQLLNAPHRLNHLLTDFDYFNEGWCHLVIRRPAVQQELNDMIQRTASDLKCDYDSLEVLELSILSLADRINRGKPDHVDRQFKDWKEFITRVDATIKTSKSTNIQELRDSLNQLMTVVNKTEELYEKSIAIVKKDIKPLPTAVLKIDSLDDSVVDDKKEDSKKDGEVKDKTVEEVKPFITFQEAKKRVVALMKEERLTREENEILNGYKEKGIKALTDVIFPPKTPFRRRKIEAKFLFEDAKEKAQAAMNNLKKVIAEKDEKELDAAIKQFAIANDLYRKTGRDFIEAANLSPLKKGDLHRRGKY